MVKRELIVKEKCLMFHQISFRKLLGRGSFGLLGLCCCPHNLVPDKRIKMDRGRLKPTPFRLVFCFSLRAFFIVILSISCVMMPCKTVNDDQKAKLSIITQKYLKTHFSVKHSCRQFTHRVVHTHR